MRHGKRRVRLGMTDTHRVAALRNMALGLIEHGRIKTTSVRAKILRPFLEPIVTQLKDPSVANVRWAMARLPNKAGVMKIMKEISPAFKTRNGGYLRILKLAKPRPGDCADMALIEWVDENLVDAYKVMKGEKEKAAPKKKGAAKKTAGAKKAKAPAEGTEAKAEKKTAKAKKKA